MKKEFRLSDTQYNELMIACRPVPYMIIGGFAPRSRQENANAAWQALGKQMNFKWDTVEPVPGKSEFFFMAEPKE